MVGLQTLDLAIGVRVPASQPQYNQTLTGGAISEPSVFVCLWCASRNFGLFLCRFCE